MHTEGNYIPSTQYRRFIRRRLMTLGMNFQAAKTLADRVHTQVEHRGYEGAVNYLKRVGDQLLLYLKREGRRSNASWVATTRSGFPKFLDVAFGLPEDVLIRIAKLARSIRLRHATSVQAAKVKTAAVRSYGGTKPALVRCASLAKEGLSRMGFVSLDTQPDYSADRNLWFVRQYRHTDSLSGDLRDYTEKSQLASSLERYLCDPILRELPIEPMFYPFTREYIERLKQVIPPSADEQVVGVIGATQEGGAKLRMFSSPYLVYQYALYPIHYWIADNFLKEVPQICTYSQESGAKWAQEQLRLGHVVHSVDLSTATCRWPLAPQLEMLRFLGLDERFVRAVERTSRGTWKLVDDLKPSFQSDTLKWSTGQPLGIAPSMSMFTLNHAAVLAGLASQLGVADTFRVLGDDVVIVGDELYHAYVSLLDEMDVPISYNKSHSSALVAEFAGYTITRDTLCRAGQWRPVHKKNTISLAEELQMPTPLEVSQLAADIQAYRLFALGLYDPAPDEWPSFLKVTSELVASALELPALTSAVLLEYKAGSLAEDAIMYLQKRFRLSYNLRALGVRVFAQYESESAFINAIFGPLSEWSSDDVVVHFRSASKHFGVGNHAMIVSNAFTCLFSLWERDVIKADTLEDVVAEIISNYYSRLFLTPRSTRYSELNTLYDRYKSILTRSGEDTNDAIWSVRASRRRQLLQDEYLAPVTNADFVLR